MTEKKLLSVNGCLISTVLFMTILLAFPANLTRAQIGHPSTPHPDFEYDFDR